MRRTADQSGLAARLLSRITVDPATGCWLWQGALDSGGYGRLWFDGLVRSAHRLAAHLWLGLDLASPQLVLHRCDERRCCNPLHLELGSQAENIRQAVNRGRFNRHSEPPPPSEGAVIELPQWEPPMTCRDMPIMERLLARRRVNPTTNCWEWIGAAHLDGYGHLRIDGKMRKVHRVAAYLWLGFDLTSPLVVAHRCDNPSCFNPAHLRPMSQAENVHDAFDRGRRRDVRKLSGAAVLDIRRRRAAGEKGVVLAAEYQVSQATISNIVHSREWRHLRDDGVDGRRLTTDPPEAGAIPATRQRSGRLD